MEGTAVEATALVEGARVVVAKGGATQVEVELVEAVRVVAMGAMVPMGASLAVEMLAVEVLMEAKGVLVVVDLAGAGLAEVEMAEWAAEEGDTIRSFCTCTAGSSPQDYLGTMRGIVRRWNRTRNCLSNFQVEVVEVEAKGLGAGQENPEAVPVAAAAAAEVVKVGTWGMPCTCIECNDPRPAATCSGTMRGTPRMLYH